METARDRYEAKTKVVTFRVTHGVFKQLEQAKRATNLSFSDFIKLGANIADEEIKAKLAEIDHLEDRLIELKTMVKEEQENLDDFIRKEKKRRFRDIDAEMEALKLFDRGWSMEEVGFKLGITESTLLQYLQEWEQEREDKPVIKRELLRACLKKHIGELKKSLSWGRIIPSTPEERIEELQAQIADWQKLLATPSQITKEIRGFLLAEYSSAVSPAAKNKEADR